MARCWSGANVTVTDPAASSVRVIATPFGMAVMSLSFWVVPGATHSAHGQLSLSHTAGKRSTCPLTVSSRSEPIKPTSTTCSPEFPASKVGYTS